MYLLKSYLIKSNPNHGDHGKFVTKVSIALRKDPSNPYRTTNEILDAHGTPDHINPRKVIKDAMQYNRDNYGQDFAHVDKNGKPKNAVRKSQLSLFGHDHHIAYTRTNKNGTVSQIKQKGPVHEQGALDFTAPPPEPEKPKGPQLSDGSSYTDFIHNGKELFSHITGFDKSKHEAELAHLDKNYRQTQKHWEDTRQRIRQEMANGQHHLIEHDHQHPEYKVARQDMFDARENIQKHHKKAHATRKQIIEYFTNNADMAECKKKAEHVGRHLNKKQQKAMAEFYALVGHHNLETLRYAGKLHNGGRAYANKDLGVIELDDRDSANTVWHECGHHAEHSAYGMAHECARFRTSRAQKDKDGRMVIKKLSELTKDTAYKDEEVAVKDKFVKPYIGKVYKHGSTEIVSMGFDMMATDSGFKKLLEKDPEHLHLMVGILHHLNGRIILH